MSDQTIANWAAARSEKWRRQLTGLEAMLAPIDGPLIEALELTTAVRVVDVGCGSGATTASVLRSAPAGSVAHGFDLSPALIDVARRRWVTGGDSLAFDVADMASATPPQPAYDRLVSRLGVMFFNDAPAAFANLHRWLAPWGRFAFAVWGAVEDNAWMQIAREVVASVADVPPIDTAAPGPFRYGSPEVLLSQLERAGFSDVQVRDWCHALQIGGPGADAAARFALDAFACFAESLRTAGSSAASRAHRNLRQRFARFERHGVVAINARIHIVTGRAR